MNKCIGIVRGTIVQTRITGSICQTGYIVLPGNYRYYADDIAIWRKGVRGNYFVYDKALTPMGFDGDEGIDWINVKILS
jgi:hypothetical protein